MNDLRLEQLPVVPLEGGAILPHMVVTVSLRSDEARAAVGASAATGGHVLLVPRRRGAYAPVGTVAKVEDRGTLPGGDEVCVMSGLHRAVIGAGAQGDGRAL